MYRAFRQGTNCYPQSASISASPPDVTVPYAQGAVQQRLIGTRFNCSNPCIWVSKHGCGAELWACSGGGAIVPSGRMYRRMEPPRCGSAMEQRFAFAQHRASCRDRASRHSADDYCSPMVVSVPAGQSASTSISYNLAGSGYTAMCIWVQNNVVLHRFGRAKCRPHAHANVAVCAKGRHQHALAESSQTSSTRYWQTVVSLASSLLML